MIAEEEWSREERKGGKKTKGTNGES